MGHECIQVDRVNKLEDKSNKLCKFQGSTESDIKTIFNQLEEIKNNDLRHINQKINALLFTVLGSVFVSVIYLVIRLILRISNLGGP